MKNSVCSDHLPPAALHVPRLANGNLCKHILFVNLRVLRLQSDSPIVWQRALLDDEVGRRVCAVICDACSRVLLGCWPCRCTCVWLAVSVPR